MVSGTNANVNQNAEIDMHAYKNATPAGVHTSVRVKYVDATAPDTSRFKNVENPTAMPRT